MVGAVVALAALSGCSTSHTKSPDEVFRAMNKELAQTLQNPLGIDWKWDGDALQVTAAGGPAKGTKGEVRVSDSNVRVQVDLPMLLRVMKGVVEQKVNEKLDKSLARGQYRQLDEEQIASLLARPAATADEDSGASEES